MDAANDIHCGSYQSMFVMDDFGISWKWSIPVVTNVSVKRSSTYPNNEKGSETRSPGHSTQHRPASSNGSPEMNRLPDKLK